MNTLTARHMVKAVDRVARCLELVEEEAWIRDRGWRFLFANTSFARYLEESPADLEGRLDLEMFRGEEVRNFRRDDGHCVRLAAPSFFVEDAPPHRDSHDTLKFPLLLPSGEVVGVVGIACFGQRPRPGVRSPAWLRRVRSGVAAAFAEGVSVRASAARAGVHPDHLGRSFKRHYGLSVHELVRRLRLQWSCWAILADPGRRLGELAAGAGFSDQSHFNREFRRVRGISPGDLRERCREAAAGRGDSVPFRLSILERLPRTGGPLPLAEPGGARGRGGEPR